MSVYHYIFYLLYRFFKSQWIAWWSEVKAVFIISAVEGLVIALSNFKIALLCGVEGATQLGKWGYILVIGIPPFLFNYFFFQYNDRWKPIVKHFDKAGKKEKRKMNILTVVVLLIVGGLVAFLFSV